MGDSVVVPRVTSRGERLANALRRGFVSARVLQLRAGPPALSELVGPMAPERYLALPRRSVVAARAMVAVALAKGDRDVARLETFRRSGSLRVASGRTKIPDMDDGTPREWFDEVAAALLGDPMDDAIIDAVDTMKMLTLGPNKCHATLRRAQMPAEAFRLEATGGLDYTEATAPAREQDDAAPAPLLAKVESVDVDALPPADPLPPAPPEDMLFPELDDAEGKAALPEIEIGEPLPEVNTVDAIDAMEIDVPDKAPLEGVETQSQPVVDVDDIVDAAPLKKPETEKDVAFVSQKVRNEKKQSSDKPDDPATVGNSGAVPEGACTVTGKKGTRFSLWLSEYEKEKISVDFHVESPAGATLNSQPAAKQTEMEVVEVDDVPTVDLRSDGEDAEAGYKVRQDGPMGMLDDLLHDLNNKDPSPKRASGRPAPPSTEVVTIDGDDEGERNNQGAAPPLKRPRKRKLGSFVRNSRRQIEERKARMMSAVVQTLQGDPEVPKKRSNRAAASVANGHRSAQARKGDDKERRHSRRSKKNISIVDSSEEGEPFESKEADGDFDLDDEDDGAVEVPPASRSPPAKAASPKSPPAPRANPAPRATRSRPMKAGKPAPIIAPITEEQNGEIEPEKPKETSNQGSQYKWERQIAGIEKVIATNDTGSPSLSSAEDDIEGEMLSESIPTLGRLMEPVRDGDRCLVECDQYIEHDAMMQFYRDTRNDPPYAPDAKSSGTEYQLEIWRQRQARSRLRFSAPDPDEELEGDGFEDRAPLASNGIGGAGGTGTGGERSRISSGSRESSEGSSVRSDSSDGEDDGGVEINGGKGHRSGRSSRAVRARELQSRVCGDLLTSMSAEAKRRVLRWAEKDYSWFDDGTEMMEIVASRIVKACPLCDSIDGKYREHCEESILLKLWTNMTWRKVRRMRHRVRGVNHSN